MKAEQGDWRETLLASGDFERKKEKTKKKKEKMDLCPVVRWHFVIKWNCTFRFKSATLGDEVPKCGIFANKGSFIVRLSEGSARSGGGHGDVERRWSRWSAFILREWAANWWRQRNLWYKCFEVWCSDSKLLLCCADHKREKLNCRIAYRMNMGNMGNRIRIYLLNWTLWKRVTRKFSILSQH